MTLRLIIIIIIVIIIIIITGKTVLEDLTGEIKFCT